MGPRALWETWRTPREDLLGRGRAGQEGRNHGGCQLQLPTRPMSEGPGEPATLLTDIDSPLASWEQTSGRFPQTLLSTAWPWPPTGNAGRTGHLGTTVMPNTFPPAQMSPNTRLCADCSLCLICLVPLGCPAGLSSNTTYTKMPFQTPLGRSGTCPSSAWPSTAPSTGLWDTLTTLPCPSLLAGGSNHPGRCVGTGTICFIIFMVLPRILRLGLSKSLSMNE